MLIKRYVILTSRGSQSSLCIIPHHDCESQCWSAIICRGMDCGGKLLRKLFVRNCGPGLGPILSILGTLPALTRPRAIFLGWSSEVRQSRPWLLVFAFKVENSTRCQNHPESARDNQEMPGMIKY